MFSKVLKKYLHILGYSISRAENNNFAPVELDKDDLKLVNDIRLNNLSMTTTSNLYATVLACKYIIENEIPGDFVECGVYRGGHSIIAASIFKRYQVKKKVYLFDTFAGMTVPTKFDKKSSTGEPAIRKYDNTLTMNYSNWAYSPLEEVERNFQDRHLSDYAIFVKGDVLNTLLNTRNITNEISFLRLDTDWYESTKLELEILYPKLMRGGVLVIDDYGSWDGVLKAVNEYFSSPIRKPYLGVIDSSARLSIKYDF
jgi:hypothetical protein